MKKILLLIAIVSLILIFSCSKKEENESKLKCDALCQERIKVIGSGDFPRINTQPRKDK